MYLSLISVCLSSGLPGLQIMRLPGMFHPPMISPPTPTGVALVKPSFLAPSPATIPHPPMGAHAHSGSSPQANNHTPLLKGTTGATTVMLHHHTSQVCEGTLMPQQQGRALPGMPWGRPQLSSLSPLASPFCQTAAKMKMTYHCQVPQAYEP